MIRKSYVAMVLAALSLAACVTPQGRPDNTATGALIGGATGAIIGSTARHSGSGALVGAAVGAVAGGAIGHAADMQQEGGNGQVVYQQAPYGAPPAPAPLVETVVVSPGPGWLWVAGGWFWGGGNWVWHRGYWHNGPRRYYGPGGPGGYHGGPGYGGGYHGGPGGPGPQWH